MCRRLHSSPHHSRTIPVAYGEYSFGMKTDAFNNHIEFHHHWEITYILMPMSLFDTSGENPVLIPK